jgi:hypothetical protein
MRNLVVTLSMLILVTACGPSSKEISAAKTARYKGEKVALFNAVKAATEEKYKIAKSDETALGFQTVGKWYTPEGLVAERQDDMRMVPDRSLNIVLVVTLVPDGDLWVVKVVPEMLRFFQGRPNPDKLGPTDPSVPGWANDRVESLQYDIYTAMKPYEAKAAPNGVMSPPPIGPGSTPTPPPTAPADPATPTPTTPAP